MNPFPSIKTRFLLNSLCAGMLVTAAMTGPGALAQSADPAAGSGQATTVATDADLAGLKIRHDQPQPLPTMFRLGAGANRPPQLQFLPPDQMNAADRQLADENQEEIERRANLQGFGLSRNEQASNWGYEQAVCPVFPEHIVLAYSRDNGAGDVTLFTAVVPRAEGHVRVIPVQRRGYSLFTPSPKNELTITDFNHIVKEEGHGLDPDWLTLGLCYAAMAGGHVRAALAVHVESEEHYPLFEPAKLTVYSKGGALVNFADTTPHVRSMNWVMTFTPNGQLAKVKHSDSDQLVERPVAGRVVEVP